MPNTAIATRTRPFTSPHPVANIQADAIARRDEHFAIRRTCIADLVRDNPQEPDEFYWTMVYDLEHAPTVTARARLLEHGIIPVPPQELTNDTDLHDELWTIIEGLSLVGLFLMNTDHLTDRDLYCRLYYKILDEQTRLMPPASEAAEYIDCFHSMDVGYPLSTRFNRRGSPPARNPADYKRGPICATLGTLQNRDTHLPGSSFSPSDSMEL